jgi:hypothetical protein
MTKWRSYTRLYMRWRIKPRFQAFQAALKTRYHATIRWKALDEYILMVPLPSWYWLRVEKHACYEMSIRLHVSLNKYNRYRNQCSSLRTYYSRGHDWHLFLISTISCFMTERIRKKMDWIWIPLRWTVKSDSLGSVDGLWGKAQGPRTVMWFGWIPLRWTVKWDNLGSVDGLWGIKMDANAEALYPYR